MLLKNLDKINKTGKSIIFHSFMSAFGLFIFGLGVYMTIRADAGVAPWDVLELGISKVVGISYGNASIAVSVIVIVIDIFLREKIGIGMVLDAVIVGKTVDLLNFIDLVPKAPDIWFSVLYIAAGLVLEGYSQVMYMGAALGCGPRDTYLVGLSRRIKRVPIGVISICNLSIVTFIGWLLGGPVGIGTVVCAFGTGPVMQLAFKTVGFVAEDVPHQSFADSYKVIFNKNKVKTH